ncbi:MAG: hypothetical protein NTW26_06790 [bacterium]|nr:hypothetical protein [bacterium]
MRRVLIFVFLLAAVSLGAEKIKLAFIGLEASGVSESAAAGISDAILDTLVNTHRFDVVERAQLTAILEEQALTLSGCTSTECIVEVGQLAGADKALVGQVSQVGSIYNLTLRLADVTTGKLEYSDSAESLNLEELLNEGRSIVQRFADSIPVMGVVIGVEKDIIKVNLGTQENLNPGDELEVYRIGEEYYDPETGLLVGHDTIELGKAVVSRVVDTALSEAKLSGEFEVTTGDRVRLAKIISTGVTRHEITLESFQIHLGGGYPFIGDFSVTYSSRGEGYLGLSVATVLMSNGIGLDPDKYVAQTGDTMISLDYDFFFGRIFRVSAGLGSGVFFRSDVVLFIVKVKAGVEYRLSSTWGISAGVDYYPVVAWPEKWVEGAYFGKALNARIGVEFYL